MYYYTANTYNYPYTWSTTSTSTTSTSTIYRPYKPYDCSGWALNVIRKKKGLDIETVTEDMIENLLKEDDK